jgi:hypothetical protein
MYRRRCCCTRKSPNAHNCLQQSNSSYEIFDWFSTAYLLIAIDRVTLITCAYASTGATSHQWLGQAHTLKNVITINMDLYFAIILNRHPIKKQRNLSIYVGPVSLLAHQYPRGAKAPQATKSREYWVITAVIYFIE